MKKFLRRIILFFNIFLIGILHSQTSSENYVYSSTCLDADCIKKSETVKYFDGLGKPIQIISVKSSPGGKDVVVPLEYDGYGRSVKSYLPIPQQTTENGNIFTNPFSSATAVYGSEKYFSESILEKSPLGRPEEKISVGNDWINHSSKLEYDTNSPNDNVRKFSTTTMWSSDMTISTVKYENNYEPSQLYKLTSIDENNHKNIIFKNSQGQLILSRKVLSPKVSIDTYFIYNEYDQLAAVITPKAVNEFFDVYGAGIDDQIPDDIIKNLCYQYRYDGRNRLVEKKLPGKNWEYLVYDKQNRVVLSQDGNLGSSKQWAYNKYDEFGRLVYSGIYTGSQNYGSQGRNFEQNIVNTKGSNNTLRTSSIGFTDVSGMELYYNNDAYPNTDIKVLNVNYFDFYPQYSFNPAFPITIQNQEVLNDDQITNNKSTKSLSVLNFIKNIEDNNWTKIYTYYDKKSRLIGSHSINHLGGYTRVESQLDLSGAIQKIVTSHSRLASDVTKSITETFEYDPQYRLKKHWHQVGLNTPELLTENIYNELSQIVSKNVGNNLQSINYTYNIRGWLTKVNDPQSLSGKLFGYELKYTDPVYTSLTQGRYNGNIAEVDWASSKDGVLKRYSYQYDDLNRLRKGIYSEPNNSLPQNEYYNEAVDYDLNGNIISLQRNRKLENVGRQQIDNLAYFYTGNKLDKIVESQPNYFGYPESSGNLMNYDSNGNMTDHIDKGLLEIKYNFLDLPDYVKFDQYVMRDDPFGFGLTAQYKNTSYLYRADGTKLKKIHNYFSGRNQNNASKITEYLDGFQYNYDLNSLGVPATSQGLQFVPTSEGYYDFAQNKYIYQYKDQVGNVRLSFYKDSNGIAQIDRTTDFYPFGLEFGGDKSLNTTGSLSPDYTYSFQEQEKQQETGWYSFKWRNYDPSMARFFNIDPLSEVYAYQSHYNFSENRVIDARELEGLEKELVNSGASFDGMSYDGGVESTLTWGDGLKGADIERIVLQGQAVDNKTDASGSFNWSDAGRTAVGFVPVVGSGFDIYEGARDGNWVQFGFGVGGLVLDVATLGSGSIIKGGVKTLGTHLIEEGMEKAAKEAAEEIVEKETKNLALGLGDDLFNFAEHHGFETYRDFSTGFQKNKILDAMKAYDKIHFNTTGFGKVNFSRFKPNTPISYRNYTNWEMHTIMNDPALLQKTTFYNKSFDGTYKIIDNYSPFFK